MPDVSFFRSLSPLDRDVLNLYVNFIARAIIPVEQDADVFYRAHASAIEDAAAMLRGRFGVPAAPLWRGILLDPGAIGADMSLAPIGHITYLSFSEERTIAEEFANPQAWISALVRLQKPHVRGYLIKYEPSSQEVLFSHHWAEPMGINHMRIPMWNADSVTRQREVIIRQQGHRFLLTDAAMAVDTPTGTHHV
jgi:hypothetical protein